MTEEKSTDLIYEALEIYNRASTMSLITLQARAQTYLGELAFERGRYESAIRRFTFVSEIAERHRGKRFAQKIRAWTLANLAEALFRRSKGEADRVSALEQCEHSFFKGLRIAQQIERRHTIAHCAYGLGITLREQRKPGWKQYLKYALSQYQRLGKIERIKEIEKILSDVKSPNIG